MKRLLVLALVTLAAGIALALLLRFQASRPRTQAPEETVLARFDAEAEITASGLIPPRIRVPKDHEVHLLVRGGPQSPEGILVLLGYEDLAGPVDIGPGQSREIVFPSRRPGDDFALALGDSVIGRLEVTGGHLEEGHR